MYHRSLTKTDNYSFYMDIDKGGMRVELKLGNNKLEAADISTKEEASFCCWL